MSQLTPAFGRALVQLGEKYDHIKVQSRAYEGKSNGILIAATGPLDLVADLHEGCRVYWEEMREGATVTRDGVEYVFIKLEDIDGYEVLDER